MAAKPERRFKVVADNRKARFNYAIGEAFEAGIVLTGSEVKSLRAGKATIAESYADARAGELWLINSNIPEYLQASRFNHTPKRARKLLLQKREINRLVGAVEREGMSAPREVACSSSASSSPLSTSLLLSCREVAGVDDVDRIVRRFAGRVRRAADG